MAEISNATKKKNSQFNAVVRLLITSTFSSLDYRILNQTSPRNNIYKLEAKLPLGMKIKRTKTKNKNKEDSIAYTVYSIDDVEIMRKVIAIYKANGGELTEQEERLAFARCKDTQGDKNDLFT